MSKPFDQARVDRIRRLYETHGSTVAAEIAGTNSNTIRNMRNRGWKVGKEGPPIRPMPSDYRIQSAVMTVRELVEHYRAGTTTVQRWSEEIGRQRMVSMHKLLPTPFDLVEIVGKLGPEKAAAHYGVSTDTVLKWRRAAGLPLRGEKKAFTAVGWVDRIAAKRRAA